MTVSMIVTSHDEPEIGRPFRQTTPCVKVRLVRQVKWFFHPALRCGHGIELRMSHGDHRSAGVLNQSSDLAFLTLVDARPLRTGDIPMVFRLRMPMVTDQNDARRPRVDGKTVPSGRQQWVGQFPPMAHGVGPHKIVIAKAEINRHAELRTSFARETDFLRRAVVGQIAAMNDKINIILAKPTRKPAKKFLIPPEVSRLEKVSGSVASKVRISDIGKSNRFHEWIPSRCWLSIKTDRASAIGTSVRRRR